MNGYQVGVVVFITIFACWIVYQIATSIEKESENKRLACAIVYGFTLWIVYVGGFFGAVK